ncbi:photosynthetic complex assembly protein PuhC [Pararhizobium mangrovi]|uniref:Phosphonoacetaldehyde hydrolase n=1 Tax=Pararhizobium mangrovi TaxID=2590452 RepID=A0A506UF54_9HYPH|nr:photosynthetic complex assembly protein PuhC [Pararhizobium mangrovi]TPW30417.1 phosphonoacetaldehyde hydrolase [Pararhizobium mangrovi]
MRDMKTAFIVGPDPERPLPPWLLLSAAALIVVTIVSIAFTRYTGIGMARMDPPVIEKAHTVTFSYNGEGVTVMDAGSGAVVAKVSPRGSSFVREALRGLERNRMKKGAPADAPYRVERSTDGIVWLVDTATGDRLDLRAFGSANARAFAGFLAGGKG